MHKEAVVCCLLIVVFFFFAPFLDVHEVQEIIFFTLSPPPTPPSLPPPPSPAQHTILHTSLHHTCEACGWGESVCELFYRNNVCSSKFKKYTKQPTTYLSSLINRQHNNHQHQPNPTSTLHTTPFPSFLPSLPQKPSNPQTLKPHGPAWILPSNTPPLSPLSSHPLPQLLLPLPQLLLLLPQLQL